MMCQTILIYIFNDQCNKFEAAQKLNNLYAEYASEMSDLVVSSFAVSNSSDDLATTESEFLWDSLVDGSKRS
jgi:hypothetical protein